MKHFKQNSKRADFIDLLTLEHISPFISLPQHDVTALLKGPSTPPQAWKDLRQVNVNIRTGRKVSCDTPVDSYKSARGLLNTAQCRIGIFRITEIILVLIPSADPSHTNLCIKYLSICQLKDGQLCFCQGCHIRKPEVWNDTAAIGAYILTNQRWSSTENAPRSAGLILG